MISYITNIFNYLWGYEYPKEGTRPPAPRRNHHMGTEEFPYRVKHADNMRRYAIISGIIELQKSLMKTMTAEDALKMAINEKRKRLILIRTHHKNKTSCHTIHNDVLWLYDHYKLNKSNLKFECSFQPKNS